MQKLLTLLLIVTSLNLFAQQAEERVLFVVDSIPLIEEPEDDQGNLTESEIHQLIVVTNKSEIEKHGFSRFDKVLFVTTKAYFNRPLEIKKIPTVKTMERKDGKWYLKNAAGPYTGPFIDYYLNGKKEGQGYLKEGLVDGLRTMYYANGNKNFSRTYKLGIADGEAAAYFSNGQLRNQGAFKGGKEDGLWKEWYSTGKLKRQTLFKEGKALPTKEEAKFHDLLGKAGHLFKEDNFGGTVKQLDKAIALNPEYANAYFDRGTGYLYDFKFDQAIADFDKAVELEPMYKEAFANRAFARLRKYEFAGSRTLSKTNGVTVLATKDKVEIPQEALEKICADLKKAYELGNRHKTLLEAMEKHCK